MALSEAKREPVRPKALHAASRLTMVFRELEIEGKKDWRNAWTFARYAADNGSVDCKAVVECYSRLKLRERAVATPEHVCDLAGVNANDFAAEIFREYIAFAGDAANLIEAANRSRVVRKSVAVALTNEGHRDREMLFKHSGFLPEKQGGGIHVNASANAENKVANVIRDTGMESMEANTLRMTRTLKGGFTATIEAAPDAIAPASVKALTERKEEEKES
jgi:hypothetical protein